MAQRLDFIKLPMQDWINWSALHGGQPQHERLVPPLGKRVQAALQRHAQQVLAWVTPKERARRPSRFERELPQAASQDLIWSNMQLHMDAAPHQTLAQWHQALKVDGFVLFSCLGPDTLQELHQLYALHRWGDPMHQLTDMHDWGDLLVTQGFAEPIVDMECITLTYSQPEQALQELRELGRNLHPQRWQHLRGRAWRTQLLKALEGCRNEEGRIALTFEVIYGHAIKPKPRKQVGPTTLVGLEEMREMLKIKQDRSA